MADWSESEAARALDLLGVASDLRSGRTQIDPLDETAVVAFRRELAFEELERLEALRDESMIPLDEMDRRRAPAGDLAVFSKPARLVLRYERDAWRRYNQAMKEVEASRGDTPLQPIKVVAPPPPEPAPVAPPPSKFVERRRALQASVASMRAAVVEGLRAMGIDDEDAMLEELERQVEAHERKLFPAGGASDFATERTQFCVGLAPSAVAGR